jgi:hypothetical protein
MGLTPGPIVCRAAGADGGHRGWLFSGRHSSWGNPLSLERRPQAVLGGAGPGFEVATGRAVAGMPESRACHASFAS